jgi:hypothetical protein
MNIDSGRETNLLSWMFFLFGARGARWEKAKSKAAAAKEHYSSQRKHSQQQAAVCKRETGDPESELVRGSHV